jgi:hypothetical protein
LGRRNPTVLAYLYIYHTAGATGAGALAGAAAAAPVETPAGAVAQSKVAAKEHTATGLSGSGGAVRVPAPKQTGGGLIGAAMVARRGMRMNHVEFRALSAVVAQAVQ